MLVEEIDARQYAALRIAFGYLALMTLAGLLPDATFNYSDEGWLPRAAAGAFINGRYWSVLSWITSPFGVKLFFAAAMISATSMTLGFYSRTSTLATFIAIASLENRNPFNAYGGDVVLRLMLFLIALSPSGLAWSIDAGRRRSARRAEILPLRLMQAQVCLLYFSAGWIKLHGEDWIRGDAIGLVLLNPIFARADFSFIQTWPPAPLLLKPLAQAVLGFELGFPLLVLHRRTRWLALAFGAAVHLGIAAALQVHWFSAMMLAAYLAFLPNELFRRIDEQLSRIRL